MVRKQRRRITFGSGKLKLAMTTKEKLAAKPKPDSYFRQDISIKVRRALARRHSSLPSGVSPVSFSREVSLSPLYKKEAGEKYINQVFTSVFKIGQGCFGDVYQARSKEDSNLYAIKVTNDTHTFIDKGEVIRLEKIPPHENCVRFFVAWQESYRLYIQMELCKTSLDKYLSVYHGIDERRSWEIFVDIALGLEHLHRNELIHLDLKPANIMISVNGVCKIGDFGLVLDLRELDVSINKTPVFVTVSEGDGRYVALEVLREKVYSKAADIFSLGLLMLETVSDVVLPNSGPDWVQIREGAIPFCYDQCNLSTGFRQLIERMLLKNYLLRPSIIEVLQTPHAVEILNLRQIGQRCNIMATWDEDHIAYTVSHPDIPTLQVGGPSPPRRPYPINYIPPLENARAPLKELNLADGSKTAVRTEERYVRTRNVARRLF